jgi:hypothetical protein
LGELNGSVEFVGMNYRAKIIPKGSKANYLIPNEHKT